MKGWVIAIGLAMIVAAAPSAFAQKKQAGCERGTSAKPTANGPKYQLDTATGPVVFQSGSASTCGRYTYGLLDSAGKVLIPAKYSRAFPLTQTMGVVETADRKALFYQYGKGEKPAPFNKLADICIDGVGACVYGGYLEKANGLRDYWLYPHGAEPATRITEVASVQRLGANLIAHYTAADATPLSRVLDVSGQPLSPAVSRITSFAYRPAMRESDFRKAKSSGARPAYYAMMALADLNDANLSEKTLFLPLDANGRPLGLPAGAVGVIRMPPTPKFSEDKSVGWGVAFPTAAGLEFAVTFGTLEQALTEAATAPRISGFLWHDMPRGNGFRDADFFLTIRERDGWRVGLADKFLSPSDHIYAGHYPTMEAARDAYHAALAVKEANILAARERDERKLADQRAQWAAVRAKEQADRRAQKAAEWPAVKAAGTLCEKKRDIADYPVEAVNAFLRTCEVTMPEILARTDADQSALRIGRQSHENHIEKARVAIQQKFGLRQSVNGPSGGGDPWAAGLAAALASQQASMDAVLAQQAAVYQRNYDAWNSGAQNWCCGAGQPN
jgi:hypothetical protein